MDRALELHGELIRVMLGSYLDHLAVTWRSSSDSATAVASVLDGSCRVFEASSERRRSATRLLREAECVGDGVLGALRTRLCISTGDELLLAAAWWSEVDPQLGSVFGVLHDDGSRRYPSSGVLHLIAAAHGIAVPVHPRRLVELGIVEPTAPSERLALTPTAREVVAGQIVPEPPGADAEPDADLLAGLLADLVVAGDGPVVVRGQAGTGRHGLARLAAARVGMAVVGSDRPTAELRLLARLGIAIPVVDVGDDVIRLWRREDGPLIAIAGLDDEVDAGHVLDVPMPGDTARRELWTDALNAADFDDDALCDRLADHFRFARRDVVATVRRGSTLARLAGRTMTAHDIWTAAQHRPDRRLGGIAHHIDPTFRLDDLVLPERTAARLREVVTHVAHRRTVLSEWGFGRRLARGSGVAALFTGPPGTGKTSAAEAIAGELDMMLFRIDLSRVVSKYIGETEKHLAIAFREAEHSGAMLLFDEADALFGKRTEVRDAHDRYANLEVSYLLQRIETFTGVVVLSSNRPGNIDDAFLRRLRFVVKFDVPTLAERIELWRRSFPDQAALGALDWEQLATHDLAGGHIQSAALAAAFLAAGNGRVIEQAHIDRAIAHEYEKLDRAAPVSGARR